MFNPFNLAKTSEEDLVKKIDELLGEINEDYELMSELSNNVMILSDILPIYGELQARLQKEYSLAKYQNSIKETKIAYELKAECATKYPMSYFNAMAQERMIEERREEMELQMRAQQMKYAFEATQEKINAVKKKIESIKFEQHY